MRTRDLDHMTAQQGQLLDSLSGLREATCYLEHSVAAMFSHVTGAELPPAPLSAHAATSTTPPVSSTAGATSSTSGAGTPGLPTLVESPRGDGLITSHDTFMTSQDGLVTSSVTSPPPGYPASRHKTFGPVLESGMQSVLETGEEDGEAS